MGKKDGNFVALMKCFICDDDADIILDRRLKDISELHGKTSPSTFCNHCREAMKDGVWLIETTGSVPNAERVAECDLHNVNRTGRIACISKDFFIRNGLERYADYPFMFTRKEEELFEKLGIEFEGE